MWLWQDELNPRVRCAFGNVCIYNCICICICICISICSCIFICIFICIRIYTNEWDAGWKAVQAMHCWWEALQIPMGKGCRPQEATHSMRGPHLRGPLRKRASYQCMSLCHIMWCYITWSCRPRESANYWNTLSKLKEKKKYQAGNWLLIWISYGRCLGQNENETSGSKSKF